MNSCASVSNLNKREVNPMMVSLYLQVEVFWYQVHTSDFQQFLSFDYCSLIRLSELCITTELDQKLNKPEYTHSAKLNPPKSERKYEVIKKLTPILVDLDPVEDLLFNHPDLYGIGTLDDKEVDEPQVVRKTGLRFEIEDPIDLSDANLVARYDGNLKEQELTQVKKKAAEESWEQDKSNWDADMMVY
ncbi:hypothetical protein C8J56DRAFT_888693 [Mycena floridula]|nr:hypothetical protein C8J56DRAFT_888693 [Mycena floridula]